MAPSVIVVGAGIIGASIAWHLARGGARVSVMDERGAPGGVATPASWSWINASWGNAEPYFRLRHRSMRDWRALEREVPGLGPRWTGGLLWDLPEDDLRRFAEAQGGWDYDVRLVGRAEAARIEPALAEPPEVAAFAPEEGQVEAEAAAAALMAGAEAAGARLFAGLRVERVCERGGRVAGVAAGGEERRADHVVLAAGAATSALAEGMGVSVPLSTPPGLLVRTAPARPLLRGLVMAPHLHARQRADGRLLVGADFGGSDPGADQAAAAHGLVDALRRTLQGAEDLRLEGWSVGLRPTPADGVSVAGQAREGLWLAVTHSGVTLAPVLGRTLARAILAGERDPLLAPFGPERFAA